MRVFQVLPYFCFGGAEIMCENLTCALKKQGHEVTVVCLYHRPTPISERMEQAGIRILWLDKHPGLDVTMIPKLVRIFRRERPEVVHTHLDVIKYAAPAAKLAGIPRCVHTVHSVAEKEAEGKLQKWSNTFFYRQGWSVPVALSREVAASVARFYNLKPEQVPVIHNGIDLSKCRPKESYSLGEPVRILHVGRFDVPKNHPGLLKSFGMLHRQYSQCRLTLVGDGDLRPQIENLAEELGIARWITFAGMQKNVHPYLQEADIFVLPSVYEGNPMTIIEAMGTGLPIVATTVGGIPDMLENQRNALLVPCREEAVCQACAALLEDENLRRRLGRQALADSLRFSADSMAGRYGAVYALRDR